MFYILISRSNYLFKIFSSQRHPGPRELMTKGVLMPRSLALSPGSPGDFHENSNVKMPLNLERTPQINYPPQFGS